MVLDLGGGERHRTANVSDLQPCTVETFRRRTLGQHSRGALLHHLRYKLVRVKQRPTHCGKQRSLTNTPRIVTYVRDDLCSITAEFGARYFCKSFDICHGFELCGFTTTAGIF